MPGTSDDAVRASRELRSVVNRLRRRMRELHSPEDVAAGVLSVLLRVEKEGAATAATLAAAERIRPQSMGAKIAALEEQGLIVRRPDPTDGRRLLVDLTAAGHRRVDGDRAARAEWLAKAFQDRYSDDERARMLDAIALFERLLED